MAGLIVQKAEYALINTTTNNIKTNNYDDILITSYNHNTSSLYRRDSDRARRYA
jgi:hypothetical protein